MSESCGPAARIATCSAVCKCSACLSAGALREMSIISTTVHLLAGRPKDSPGTAGCALNDDVGRAYRCADQGKPRSIKHKRLPIADNNVLAIIRLCDPQNAAYGLHAQSLTIANVEHFARLEVLQRCSKLS